jgi:hypothetical protein
MRQLFEKFTFRPEVNSKPLSIAFKVHRLSIEASPMHRVSSAYWRWETVGPPPPILKPLKRASSPALRITPPKSSATNKNKKGAKGSPCLRPL